MFQNHEFPGQTELPPGLRGCSQQADQPRAVCLLRLLVYGKSNPWCTVRLKSVIEGQLSGKYQSVTSGDIWVIVLREKGSVSRFYL